MEFLVALITWLFIAIILHCSHCHYTYTAIYHRFPGACWRILNVRLRPFLLSTNCRLLSRSH